MNDIIVSGPVLRGIIYQRAKQLSHEACGNRYVCVLGSFLVLRIRAHLSFEGVCLNSRNPGPRREEVGLRFGQNDLISS